jgi:hypothetical protein
MRDDNKKQIIQQISSFLEQHPEIIFAYLHGSFLTHNHFHDIDLALYLFQSPPSYLEYEISLEAECILSLPLSAEIDIRVLNGAPLYFRFSVIKEGEILFCKDETILSDFREETIRDYLDYEYFYRQQLREALNF